MLTTLLLARIIGVYMVIGGAAVLADRRRIMLAVVALTKERFAQLMAGVFALFVGLIIINIHTDWSSLPAAVISLMGWLALLKGIAYLLLPASTMEKMMQSFMDRKWFMIDGLLVIVIGAYLAGFGYGLW
jgi:hypothetical protein